MSLEKTMALRFYHNRCFHTPLWKRKRDKINSLLCPGKWAGRVNISDKGDKLEGTMYALRSLKVPRQSELKKSWPNRSWEHYKLEKGTILLYKVIDYHSMRAHIKISSHKHTTWDPHPCNEVGASLWDAPPENQRRRRDRVFYTGKQTRSGYDKIREPDIDAKSTWYISMPSERFTFSNTLRSGEFLFCVTESSKSKFGTLNFHGRKDVRQNIDLIAHPVLVDIKICG